jgi:hypothetical protein
MQGRQSADADSSAFGVGMTRERGAGIRECGCRMGADNRIGAIRARDVRSDAARVRKRIENGR